MFICGQIVHNCSVSITLKIIKRSFIKIQWLSPVLKHQYVTSHVCFVFCGHFEMVIKFKKYKSYTYLSQAATYSRKTVMVPEHSSVGQCVYSWTYHFDLFDGMHCYSVWCQTFWGLIFTNVFCVLFLRNTITLEYSLQLRPHKYKYEYHLTSNVNSRPHIYSK